jgi:uncharacterized membrane protein
MSKEEANRQNKKAQFTTKKRVGSKTILAVMAGVLITSVVVWLLLGRTTDGIASVKVADGFVSLSLADINDGEAHFFKLSTDKGDIKFFVVKSLDGVMRAAFDACDVCYKEKKGYRQEGNVMVCNNCGQQFQTDLVNEVKGGCNPAPLQRRLENNKLLIAKTDLLQGGGYFGL